MAEDDVSYGPESIEVLVGLEAVRKRPGMYVGDTRDGSGLHHLLWEVVANAIDEHLAGHATRIEVTVEDTAVTVQDDGRGIPADLLPSGRSALEIVFTMLHAGSTRDGHTPHVHIGWNTFGVGLAAVNALCEELRAVVVRGGRRYEIGFTRGDVTSPLTDCGPDSGRGTRIMLRPDPTIFEHPRFDRAAIRDHLRQLSFFNPDLTIVVDGEVFHSPRGLAAMVAEHVGHWGEGEMPPLVHVQGEADDVRVEVAMSWSGDAEPRVLSFVGQAQTPEGGTHVAGLTAGFDAAMESWLRSRGRAGTARLERSPGLVAVVHVGLYDPRFGGPTRARLASAEARAGVEAVVVQQLPTWLDAHPEQAQRMVERCGIELDGP